MRRALALLPLFAVIAACRLGNAPPVGVSDKSQGGGPRPADAGAPFGPSDLPAQFRTTYTKLNATPFVSMGHAGGRWEAEVYRSTAGTATEPLPIGARLVMEHFERAGSPTASERRGPLFVIEKMPAGYAPEHGDLRYVVVSSAGQTKLDGADPSCAGCHDDAPKERLFALPAK